MKETNTWNADKYNKHADFVSKLAMPVIDLLEPQTEWKDFRFRLWRWNIS